jgi:hypothetical protein
MSLLAQVNGEEVQHDRINTRCSHVEVAARLEAQGKKETATEVGVTEPLLLSIFGGPKYHPLEIHGKRNIVLNGEAIELEDGSQWKVSDPKAIETWTPYDQIVITPILAPWSWNPFSYSYSYFLNNITTGTYVKATLHEGAFKSDFYNPSEPNPYRHVVVDCFFAAKRVYLDKDLVYQISPDDMAIFEDFAANDAVIIGVNDSLRSMLSEYNSVLINVNMNIYVRAKRI